MAALVDDAELAALLASVEAHDEDASAELRASFELEELLGPAGGEELVLSADVAIDKVDAALLGDVDAASDSSDSQAAVSTKIRPAPSDWSESPLPASSPSSDGQSSDPQPPAAQQEPRRRRRQKDEIEYLRKKAAELEDELAKLKARADAGLPVVDDEPSCALGPFALDDGTASSETQEKPLFWQRIARRQLHSRYRAQRENEQLKEMVEGQLGIIRGLEKVLKKRAAIEGTQQWLDDRKRTRVVHDSEAVIFEKLKMDLDGRFKQTDSVFEGNSYATRYVDGNNFQIKVDGTDGMFVEFVTSKIVPFGLPETSDAFWRCFTRGNMELKDGHFSLIDNTDDTLAAKMVLSVRENNYTVLRDAKFVVRRYIEENQSVFIWACQAEAEGSLTKAKGLQVFDLGWTRVKPLTRSRMQQAAADEDMHVTIIQTCARVKIKLPAALEHTQEDIVFLTDLVTGSYMTNMVGIHQAIEDLLVEEALQKGG